MNVKIVRDVWTPVVDAFVTKTLDINANFKLIASNSGFTKQAIEKCSHYGIETISLLDNENIKPAFTLSVLAYVRIFYFIGHTMNFAILGTQPNFSEVGVYKVKYNGQPVIDWFKKKLDEEYCDSQTPQKIEKEVIFRNYLRIMIHDEHFRVRAINFTADRRMEVRRKEIKLKGDAVWDWQKEALSVPGKGKGIATEAFQVDFLNWELFMGEVPEKKGIFDLRFLYFIDHFTDENKEVVDLDSLAADKL